MHSSTRRPPLRWRKQPDERGRDRFRQQPRRRELRRGGETLACVEAKLDLDLLRLGWIWYARHGDQPADSFRQPKATIEEAQAEAEAWVRGREAERESDRS